MQVCQTSFLSVIPRVCLLLFFANPAYYIKFLRWSSSNAFAPKNSNISQLRNKLVISGMYWPMLRTIFDGRALMADLP